MTRYDICKLCHGINHTLKCMFCKMSITDYRKMGPKIEAQVHHNQYLKRTWDKLKRFKMITSGLFSLDEQLIGMWGVWIPQTAAVSYARDCMRGKPFPVYLNGTDLGREIENIFLLLNNEKIHETLIEVIQ